MVGPVILYILRHCHKQDIFKLKHTGNGKTDEIMIKEKILSFNAFFKQKT